MEMQIEYGGGDPGVIAAARDFLGKSGDAAPHRTAFEECHDLAEWVAVRLGFEWIEEWREGRCSTCGDLCFPVYSTGAQSACELHLPTRVRVGAKGDPLTWMREELEAHGVVIMSPDEYLAQAPGPVSALCAARNVSVDEVAAAADIAPGALADLAENRLENLSALDLVRVASVLDVHLADLVDTQLVEARMRLSASDGLTL